MQISLLTRMESPNNCNGSPDFAKRLESVAERVGGPSRLAEKAGISPSSLSRYLTGVALPKLSSAAAIAKAADVTLDWLGTGRGSTTGAASGGDTVAFYDLQASAGPGLLAPDNEPAAQTILLPLAQIRRQTGVASPNLCALLAEGDSMEPTIRSGALLLLDRAFPQPREGVYVLVRGDDVLLKRIQPRGPNCLRLISDNGRYAAEDVSLDDASAPVRLVGRVIWIGQPI
jgi:phage repressor protein C with HTH and peptisase S24 domain